MDVQIILESFLIYLTKNPLMEKKFKLVHDSPMQKIMVPENESNKLALHEGFFLI